MGGKDFIPSTDADFNTFLKSFHDGVTANQAPFGLAAADVTLVQTVYAAWIVAYPAHTAAQLAAHEAAVAKDKSHDQAEAAVRSLAKKINGNPAVDNLMRAQAGLPAHDLVKTPVAVPTTYPVGRLEATTHFTLVLHFVDQLTPLQTAKPHGVHACEIRIFVGTAQPADWTGYTLLAYDTRTPYTDVHPAADAGKTAYYMIRWINSKMEPGPWGDVISAKIPV